MDFMRLKAACNKSSMIRKFLIGGIVYYLAITGISIAGVNLETKRLVVRDITGNISLNKLEILSKKADSTLTKILRFWSAEPRIRRS